MSSQATQLRFEQPLYEVADVFRLYGPAYRRTHSLPLHHHKAMNDIERCRTAALGGHRLECDNCGHQRLSYNSCRNRHCPKCQGTARARWVAARQSELLPIEYFHVVFTLPDSINPLLRWNQRLLLNLLFKAVSETLLEFAERHLGGESGITAVLHTWGQTLVEHPHLHCIVTGGALAKDGRRWRSCRRGYLFPVRALSQVFRGKYCASLERAFARGELLGRQALSALASPSSFAVFLRELRRQAWVVYAKRPLADPEQVIEYLGRYTHRVAITNHRITSIERGMVSFTWKDYRDGERRKVLTLRAEEFIRRFLLHVLPPEFVRLRHYGLLAHDKRAKLRRCRELLGVGQADLPQAEQRDDERPEAAGEEWRCESCGVGRMMRREELPYSCGPPRSGEVQAGRITHS